MLRCRIGFRSSTGNGRREVAVPGPSPHSISAILPVRICRRLPRPAPNAFKRRQLTGKYGSDRLIHLGAPVRRWIACRRAKVDKSINRSRRPTDRSRQLRRLPTSSDANCASPSVNCSAALPELISQPESQGRLMQIKSRNWSEVVRFPNWPLCTSDKELGDRQALNSELSKARAGKQLPSDNYVSKPP
jgi:hypothetical protein